MKEKKTTKKSVFLIGIGGISMSGLALILKNEGYNVSGSDVTKNENTQKLKENGIKVYYSHKASLVKSCDLVVFSGAIKEDNPQIKFAKECGIEVIERSVLLARVSKKYKNVIAVSGTHGKTTTTAMLGYIFILAGLNPTIHVGGNSEIFNGNVYIGAKEYFITEACEFRNSFLKLRPKMSVITNVEKEHLDYFKSFEREILSFNKFVELTKEKVFINFDYRDLFRENEKIEFFNRKNIEAKNIVLEEDGKYSFDYYYKKRFCGNVKLNVYGKYNIENALGVIGVCKEVGIQDNIIKLGFETFRNVKRFSSNNTETAGFCEVKNHKTRVVFDRVGPNTYAVITAFMKKSDKDKGYFDFLKRVLSDYKTNNQKVLKESCDSVEFMTLQKHYELELFNKLGQDSRKGIERVKVNDASRVATNSN